MPRTLYHAKIILIFAPLNIIQMILLWRDPEGNTISVTTGNNSVSAHSASEQNLIQKIATLEMSITEKNNEIVKLKDEVNTLKQVCCHLIGSVHESLLQQLADVYCYRMNHGDRWRYEHSFMNELTQ